MQSDTQASAYPAQLSVGYPDRDLDRVTTAFRLIWAIPIAIVVAAVTPPTKTVAPVELAIGGSTWLRRRLTRLVVCELSGEVAG